MAAVDLRRNFVEHAEPRERAVRVGNQPVAADLVARKLVLVGEHNVETRAREHLCTGATARPGADNEHVTGGRGCFGGARLSRRCHRVG